MSDARFADGLRYRIEIPSVEGPAVLRAVLEEAEARDVPVRRVSQGSGVMMLTDAEIAEMAALGAEHGVEVSLFLGPRGAWDAGGQSFATGAVGGVARGQAGVEWSWRRSRRGLALGIRSCSWPTRRARGARPHEAGGRAAGDARPEDVGAPALREPADRPQRSRSSARRRSTSPPTSRRPSSASCAAACSAPLDVYVEVPDDQGGFVRFYEVPEMIRAAAPMYVKLGIRNAPNIYPVGLHLQDLAAKLGRERVRRAELVLRLLREQAPELVEGRGDDRPPRSRHPRAVKARFEAIYTAALADVLDARGHREQTLPPSIRPLAPGLRLAGPAYTVLGRPAETADHDEALRKVLRMLGEVPEGHVAVYACAQDVSAHLGELSVTSLNARGVAGCVLDGGCRDVRFIREVGFPVFSRT